MIKKIKKILNQKTNKLTKTAACRGVGILGAAKPVRGNGGST